MKNLETLNETIKEYINQLRSTILSVCLDLRSNYSTKIWKKKPSTQINQGLHFARSLVLPDDSILIISNNTAVKLWPEMDAIEDLPELNQRRINSALGFIDIKPAVIAGEDCGLLNTVEVLELDQWAYLEPVSYTHLTLPTNREV